MRSPTRLAGTSSSSATTRASCSGSRWPRHGGREIPGASLEREPDPLGPVSLRAGPYTFSHVTYDPPSDVLYAAIGRPRPGRRVETPESHFLRFDDKDRFTGII